MYFIRIGLRVKGHGSVRAVDASASITRALERRPPIVFLRAPILFDLVGRATPQGWAIVILSLVSSAAFEHGQAISHIAKLRGIDHVLR